MAKTNTQPKNSQAKNLPAKNVPAQDAELDADARALIEEVDAEVKAEKVKNFITRYGNVIGGVIIAIIVATAVGSTMTTMKVQQQEKDSESLITMLDKDLDKASTDDIKATILDLGKMANDGSGEGHRVAARLGQAGSYFKQGQTEEGLKALQALSADSTVKSLYRDFAKLLDIRARADKADAQKLLNELTPLLDAKNPWHISATELSAVLYAKLGQKDKAVEQLNKLVIDPDASSAVVERAKLLSRVYKN